jgi:arginase
MLITPKEIRMTGHDKTLRLLFPQWQGGGNPSYMFGARLLSWLAPDAAGPVEEVAVAKPDGQPLRLENGIPARRALMAQIQDARARIYRHRPDRIVVLGGDCGVELAPFAYLNERYGGELAVLWIDAHSDVYTKDVHPNAHAHVLGTLLGEGDADFLAAVKRPIKPGNAMIAGKRDIPAALPALRAVEKAVAERRHLHSVGPDDLATSSEPVLTWLRATRAKHIAIHFDLDVLDPAVFRSLTFAKPGASAPGVNDVPAGRMTMAQVVRLLSDVAQEADVVGLGITEHMPWDAIALRDTLAKLPLIGTPMQ